jgi:hypothetical protein
MVLDTLCQLRNLIYSLGYDWDPGGCLQAFLGINGAHQPFNTADTCKQKEIHIPLTFFSLGSNRYS